VADFILGDLRSKGFQAVWKRLSLSPTSAQACKYFIIHAMKNTG
jgi:hypothetical protein